MKIVRLKKPGRLIVVVCLLTALTAEASAQDAFGRITDMGLKLGLSFANLHGADVDPHLVSQVGIAGGGFITFRLSRILSLQPEILFTPKNSKLDYETDNGYGIYQYNFSYLDIPLLLKASIPLREAAIRPNLYAGPFLAVKISSKIKYKIVNSGVEENGQEDLEDIRGTDMGLVFGAGVTVAAKSGKVSLDIRYSLSLAGVSTAGDDVRHRALIFLLGYSFN